MFVHDARKPYRKLSLSSYYRNIGVNTGPIQYGRTHSNTVIGRSAKRNLPRTQNFFLRAPCPSSELSQLSDEEVGNRYICHALSTYPIRHRARFFLSVPDATSCLHARYYFCRMITFARCPSLLHIWMRVNPVG